MSNVIYRKYRPQSFDEVVGQEFVIQTLKNALAHDKVAHSYLLCGPHGTGKTSIARIFAKALNCENREEKVVCTECESCQEIEKGIAPDVIEIDAASNRGINEIRELREAVRFLPTKSLHKVYIIDEVHMLTKEAFNALLKTLEEPPNHIVFILATTEQHKVPFTIISRTQKFNLRHLSREEIDNQLVVILKKEGVEMDEETRALIVAAAEGSLRDAQSILGKVLAIGATDNENVRDVLGIANTQYIVSFVEHIIQQERGKALALLNTITARGIDMDQFIQTVLQFVRTILLVKMSGGDSLDTVFYFSKEEKDTMNNIAQNINNKQLLTLIKEMMDASQTVKYSPIPQLPIELAIVQLTPDAVEKSDKENASENNPEKETDTKDETTQTTDKTPTKPKRTTRRTTISSKKSAITTKRKTTRAKKA